MITLETLTLIICGILGVICLIALRVSPTYISDRKKRYIQPPKQKVTIEKRKEVE